MERRRKDEDELGLGSFADPGGYSETGYGDGYGQSEWGQGNIGTYGGSFMRGQYGGPSPLPGPEEEERAWRRTMGPHAGKGPKNYQRNQVRLRYNICQLLEIDDDIDASDIEVAVADGEVTLEGSVPDRQQKRRAEWVVESVYGVRDVHNRLRVQSTESIASPAR